MEAQQNKLNQVLKQVETKLSKAEGNIVRICADKLIQVRSTEMELRGLENSYKDLEIEIENLKKIVIEKDQELKNSSQVISALNSELNEKIDRLVDIGEQLEATKANHELLIESCEAKTKNFEKTKKDFEEMCSKLTEKVEQLRNQVEITVEENLTYKTKNNEISLKLGELEDRNLNLIAKDQESEKLAQNLIKQLQELSESYTKLESDKNELIIQLEACEKKLKSSEDIQLEIESTRDQCKNLRCELTDLQEKFKQLNNENSKLVKQSQEAEHELQTKCESENKLKSILEDRETSLKNLSCDLEACKNEIINLNSTLDSERAKIREESDSKVNILKNEIKFLNEKFEQEVGNMESNSEREVSELREKLTHSENMASELLKKLEDSSLRHEELSTLCEERALKVGELESCLVNLKSDLDKNFNREFISQEAFEESYELKLKNLVTDFEKQLAEKENRNRELEMQLSENADVLQSLPGIRLELKNLKAELKEKDNLLDAKIEELELLRKEAENKIINAKIDNDDLVQAKVEEYEKRIAEMKSEFDQRLLEEKHSVQLENEDRVGELESRLRNAVVDKKVSFC